MAGIMKLRLPFSAFSLVLCAVPILRAEEAGFKPLFNGTDLSGWEGAAGFWKVEDGAIVGETTEEKQPADKKNTFLIHKGGEFSDFELRLKYQVEGFNSGIQYRSVDDGGFHVSGLQSDFEALWHTDKANAAAPPVDKFSGMYFEENGRMFMAQRGEMVIVRGNAEEPKKPKIEKVASLGEAQELGKVIKRDDWNEMTVIARGNAFTHLINGQMMSMALDEDPACRAKGIFALQLHSGKPMKIKVKDVRARELNVAGKPTAAAMHPQAKAFLEAAAKAPGKPIYEKSPAEAREWFHGLSALFGKGPEVARVEDKTLASGVKVRVYRPKEGALPGVMFFHGGGWMVGSVETHDTLCRRLAKESGCAIISVDYRLAPEHKYPAALDDCHAAAKEVAEQAEAFGIDPTRLAVCGDSAGGQLAAAVALRAREMGAPKLHSQWLVYPAISPKCDTESYTVLAEGCGLSRKEMQWFWQAYGSGEDLTAANLRDLPAAHVLTAGCDVLCNEGQAYAAKLRAAGVPVTEQRHPGMLHGFLHFTEPFDESKQAIAELGLAMRNALKP
jgi:acetyl esterase